MRDDREQDARLAERGAAPPLAALGAADLPPRRRGLPAPWRLVVGATVLLVFTGSPASGQGQDLRDDPFDSSYLEPYPDPSAGQREARLTARLEHEIPLPGPLPPGGPTMLGETILIPVHGGRMRCGWTKESTASFVSGDAAAGETASRDDWSVAADGRYRARVGGDGRIEVQKRCKRCRAGWRTDWRLRVAGDGLPSPLVTDTHVYHGALDNHVYGLKRRNGHRGWETDVGGRVTRPLALWHSSDAAQRTPAELVLVIPDHGGALFALDARTGAKVATFNVPEDGGKLVGPPIATPDGRVVVARQRYAPGDASLMVFDLVPPPEPSTDRPAEPRAPGDRDAAPGA